MGAELFGDLGARRQIEASPVLKELSAKAALYGPLSFYLPHPTRAIDTVSGGAGVVGKAFEHSSDLLRRSACVQPGGKLPRSKLRACVKIGEISRDLEKAEFKPGKGVCVPTDGEDKGAATGRSRDLD
jgi:hypothetical protein